MSPTRRTLIAVATAAGALVAVTACAAATPVAIQPVAHQTTTAGLNGKAATGPAATGGTVAGPTATGAGGAGANPTGGAGTTTGGGTTGGAGTTAGGGTTGGADTTTGGGTPGGSGTAGGGGTPGGTGTGNTPPDTTLPDERNAPACLAADLVMEPVEYGGAAMGSTGVGVWVDNHGKRPCYLQGEPTLYYRDSQGTLHRLPTQPDGDTSHPAKIVVDPTAPAEFWIRHTLNYGGYDPHSAACAHPMVYRNMSVQIGDVKVKVPTLTLDVKCGAIFVSDWQLR